MDIRLTVKSVYGTEKLYPACEKSKLLARLPGTKTIRDSDLSILQALGCSITVSGAVDHKTADWLKSLNISTP